MGRLKKVLKFAGIAGSLAFALLLLAYSLPFGGWKALSVQTGSMRPAIEPGDLVLVDRVPVTSLKIGDVITYVNRQNQKQTITHRIVGINGPQITAKGDANSQPDPVVFANNVVGKVRNNVPYLGHGVDFVRTPLGLATLIYIPALAIVISEIRRLARYYRSQQPYMHPLIFARLGRDKPKNLAAGVKISILAAVVSLAIAIPVRAALISTATLTGNTISAINLQQVDHILIKSVTFECSQDSDPAGNRLAEIIFFNPTSSDKSTGNWSVRANGRTIVTFRPQTIFDAQSDYDIEPDIPLDQLGWQYSGDSLAILDSDGNVVDGISWGTDTSQLNPPLPPIFEGTKFSRISTTVDTDTASDWTVTFEPCAAD